MRVLDCEKQDLQPMCCFLPDQRPYTGYNINLKVILDQQDPSRYPLP